MQINAQPKIIRSAEGGVQPTGLHCLFDDEHRVMLGRHVMARYGMSREQYIAYCGLPSDYPMTHLDYSDEAKRLAQAGSTEKPQGSLAAEGSSHSPDTHPPIVRSAKGSVTSKLIYCLLDGEGRAFPASHVGKKFNMTWSEYLRYCGLPTDYPQVAPYYSGSDKFLDF
jgi:predicted transcriptional regulator